MDVGCKVPCASETEGNSESFGSSVGAHAVNTILRHRIIAAITAVMFFELIVVIIEFMLPSHRFFYIIIFRFDKSIRKWMQKDDH